MNTPAEKHSPGERKIESRDNSKDVEAEDSSEILFPKGPVQEDSAENLFRSDPVTEDSAEDLFPAEPAPEDSAEDLFPAVPPSEDSAEDLFPDASAGEEDVLLGAPEPDQSADELFAYETDEDSAEGLFPDEETDGPDEKPPRKRGRSKKIRLKSSKKPSKFEAPRTFAETPPVVTPGAGLKEMEKILSVSAPASIPAPPPPPTPIPRDLIERAGKACRFLFAQESVQRVAVVVENDRSQLQVAAGEGLDSDIDPITQLPARLLRSGISGTRAQVHLDLMRDTRFSKDPVVQRHQIHSALCCHFKDKQSGLRGVIYVDNCESAGIYENRDLKQLSILSQRLGDGLEIDGTPAGMVPPPRSKSKEDEVEYKQWSPLWYTVPASLLALFFIVSLFSIFWGSFQSPPPKKPVVHETTQARTTSLAFIRALKAGDYSTAHTFLSPEIQVEVSEEDLEKTIQEYLKKNNLTGFGQVSISPGPDNEKTVKSFEVRPQGAQSLKWTLILIQERWFIIEIDGGLSLKGY